TSFSTYISPIFSSQYICAADAGFIRGSYHFAYPDESSGATQGPLYVVLLSNSLLGGWSADGITLPRALDIECL
ncbi:hypothetical protein OG21DRAFT_1409022, partial [Imleria badia]